MIRVLAVDDVPAALEELCSLLHEAAGDLEVTAVDDALSVIRTIQSGHFDAVFLDIAMPGLDGMELAGLLAKLAEPPAIVFVTAYEQHAVAAYGIGAVDYLLKPVRSERMAETVDRVRRAVNTPAAAETGGNGDSGERGTDTDSRTEPAPDALAALPVESGGRTWYVSRADVRFAEAHGDYVRLHTASGSHLVRMPISRLQEYWERADFMRVHRGFLVALPAVRELRSDSSGGLLAHTDAGDVPVSRRHARQLREQLLHAAERGELAGPR